MNDFSKTESALIDIDKKIEIKPVYKKMLNNLLGIGTRDNSIFCQSKFNNMDLFNLLSAHNYQKIFSKKNFNIEISDLDIDQIVRDLHDATNENEFIEIIDHNGLSLSIADRKLLNNDYDYSNEIITKLKIKKSKVISKWKKFKNKYLDQQVQTNSWPLYIGTMFLKVKTSRTVLYAPLILKKVEIEITNTNKIYVSSLDESVEINEKLLFLLQDEYKFNIPKLLEDKSYSFDDAIFIFTSSLRNIVNDETEFQGKFEFLTKNQVKNTFLKYSKGAILTITSPGGGKLRDKLIELVKENDLDNLLNVDLIRNLKKEINIDLEEGKAIYRITQTDFSQEKAIIGSLKDSSIIWGPPGTGKSQTITNIIANLLANQEKAIITSEKKAALDVTWVWQLQAKIFH